MNILEYLQSRNSDFWYKVVVVSIIPSMVAIILANFGVRDLIVGKTLLGLLKLGIIITILLFTVFAYRTGNKLEKLENGKKNTSYVKWSKRMEFPRCWVSYKKNKEKDGYYRLTGWVESYFSEMDFLRNRVICSRYFDTVIYKGDHAYIKGVDIERIDVINNIANLHRYIEDSRRNFLELTDLCLERHNEIFNLLYSTDKYLIELSLENLQNVEGLLTIVKEDLEKVISSKERAIKQINKDESVLITKKLADELYISKQLEKRRNELELKMK
jgi:hypothetical protein